jgi:hypothetical protein
MAAGQVQQASNAPVGTRIAHLLVQLSRWTMLEKPLMRPLPALKSRLPVLMATAAVCLLSACDSYPWDPPKPTTDINNPEQRVYRPAAAVPWPLGSPSVLSSPIAPHGSGSERTEKPDEGNRPISRLL